VKRPKKIRLREKNIRHPGAGPARKALFLPAPAGFSGYGPGLEDSRFFPVEGKDIFHRRLSLPAIKVVGIGP
jgi:hypothetical protein